MSFTLYTEKQLRSIHRNVGHPLIRSTTILLRSAAKKQRTGYVRRIISRITDQCDVCKRDASTPRRLELTIRSEMLRFHERFQVENMFIDVPPMIHIVDLGTHFFAARLLKSQTRKHLWSSIQLLFPTVYLGPPDHQRVDQFTRFTLKEMKSHLEKSGDTLHEAPIEHPGSIATVQSNQALRIAAYQHISNDSGQDSTDVPCFRMAVFSASSTIAPEGLCLILLASGAIPSPARTTSVVTYIKRACAIDNVRKAVEKERLKQRITFGLRHWGGPNRL